MYTTITKYDMHTVFFMRMSFLKYNYGHTACMNIVIHYALSYIPTLSLYMYTKNYGH